MCVSVCECVCADSLTQLLAWLLYVLGSLFLVLRGGGALGAAALEGFDYSLTSVTSSLWRGHTLHPGTFVFVLFFASQRDRPGKLFNSWSYFYFFFRGHTHTHDTTRRTTSLTASRVYKKMYIFQG